MDDGQLRERGNALEEEFFRKRDSELVERLRVAKAETEIRQQMAAAVGIDDPALIDQLLAHGVTPATLAAVSLAPLVLVAWADRSLEDKERKAVLEEAAKSGVDAGSPEFGLLESWLNERPAETLVMAWASYARGVSESLDAVRRQELRDSIVSRARAVASAAGGFAGLNKVSAAEQAVLDRIEAALKD